MKNIFFLDNSVTNGVIRFLFLALFLVLLLGAVNSLTAQSIDPDAYYRLTTKWQGEGKSLGLHSRSDLPVLSRTSDFSDQYWSITPVKNGYYRLTTKRYGKEESLDIRNDDKDNLPIMAKSNNYTGQYWKFSPLGNGYYRLTTQWQGLGKSLDIVNDGNNIELILAKSGNYSGQTWKITKVDTKEKTTTPKNNSTRETTISENVYPWVNKLNLRKSSNASSTILKRCMENEKLAPTGEVSSHKDVIMLRGVLYDEPWILVQTKENFFGWVHRGAVRNKGQEKGNAKISKLKFSYPYFGTYNLSHWEKLKVPPSSDEELEGDVSYDRTKYRKGNEILEIEYYDSEYSNGIRYYLKDHIGNVLKERNINVQFDIMGEGSDDVIETVKDFKTRTKYERIQKVKVPSPVYLFFEKNGKIKMANGIWRISKF